MVALPQVYNTADLPDTGGSMPLIPPGQYQAVIVNSEFVENKNRNGHYLALKIVITQGQHANTEFVERLNIVNQNAQAVEIAYKTLARISEAVGMQQTPQDSVQLHNRPLMIEVGTEAGTAYKDNNGADKMGKDKSIIKKYLPLPGVGGGVAASAPAFGAPAAAAGFTPPAAAVVAQAPAFGQPAVSTPAPATNPFAPPAR